MVAALYRRYRPDDFADMIGQAQVTDPLMTALRTGRVNHAYLFSGPRGCGKTSSARILARCLNCAEGPTDTPCGECDSCRELARDGGGSLDVIEIDAASHGGVDDARDLRERAILAPSRDRYKIFIIDEAHMVTSAGFNALLKVVEEPPEHVRFVFATTEPEKVIGTIRSRTHHFPFRLIPPAAMLEYVEQLCASEGVVADPGVLPLVVRAGGGSARDTLSLLDQIISGSEGSRIDYARAAALLGFTSSELLDGAIDAFASGDAAAVYRVVDGVIQSGQDPRRFVEDLLERVRDLIVVKATGQGAASVLHGASPAELDRLGQEAERFAPAGLSAMADLVNDTLTEMTGVTSPRLHLELMAARILVASRATFAGDEPGGVSIERREIPDAPVASSAPAAAAEASPTAEPEPSAAPQAPAPAPAPAPASPASPPELTEPTAASGPLSFAQLRDAWPTVLDRVMREGGSAALTAVQALQPRDLVGDVLRFEIEDRAKLDRFRTAQGGAPAASDLVRAVILDLFGVTIKFQPRILGGRDERGGGAGAPRGRSDADVHRGGSGASPQAAAAPAAQPAASAPAPTGSAPSAASTSEATPSASGLNWTVAAIPGGDRDPREGPGSAWAEAAVVDEPQAPPVVREPDDADRTGGDRTGPVDGTDAAPAIPARREIDIDSAPEMIAARDLEERRRQEEADAAEHERLLRQEREAAEAGAAAAAASAAPAPAPDAPTTDGPAPATPAPAAGPQASEPWAVATPGAPGVMRSGEPPSASAQPAPPAAPAQSAPPTAPAPEAAASDAPKPARATPPPPVTPRPPVPAAGIGGVERYGESVIRELLGARFVSEEALPEPQSSFSAIDPDMPSDDDAPPPDDLPPEPEEY